MRSICFYAWNHYQLAFFEPLIDMVGGYLAIEDRSYNHDFISFAKGKYHGFNRIITIHRGANVTDLDQFDVVVAHTAFSGAASLQKAKLVFVQYGLAKEDYNYGLWRGLADANFVFGSYSKQKLAVLSSSVVVGHPVLSRLWNRERDESKLNSPKSILFAPTWGGHSTLNECYTELNELSLSGEYRITVAPHHNSVIFDDEGVHNGYRGIDYVITQEDKISALLKSDIVVSDFSGIIFDAFYLGKKVAVLRSGPSCNLSEKIGSDSIERREIGKFAITIDSIASLTQVDETSFPVMKWGSTYYESLIANIKNADEVLANELITYKFDESYADLRQKVRSHWRSIDAERESLRSEIAVLNSRSAGVVSKIKARLRGLL